ncbi:MAG: glycoside hydrolase family 15 protein [Desulfomonilia bacterium]|nr:glycoside hydrolase family 15 protein [Pseudomonadota bacterium]HON38713.1 glycoside hydrolase family 15 protein [Deltaproteobacteria bacterium]HRS55832.1 glycoside hydrolase family 15 protein [Desulfomonilia bacterium]HPD20985.1 glycoside hydrolase family 15 protein [Deltaproteobacteria bacterium]HPX17489.1 glycoside hydrolase family 15 protein [Deltaproteobacteria bacterium]
MNVVKIRDYAFLSDSQSSALVGRDGSVDWYCLPRFDSPSVFGRILDRGSGHWHIRPAGKYRSQWAYIGDSLVIRNVFHTAEGSVSLTDALMFEPGSRGHTIGRRVPHVLLRRVQGIEGETDMDMEFRPRMEYGMTAPRYQSTDRGWNIVGGPVELDLIAGVPLELTGDSIRARFRIGAGQSSEFSLAYRAPGCGVPDRDIDVPLSIEDTVAAWHSWADLHTGYQALYREKVRRSALVLQGLTYQPTGSVIAAATTSLPEIAGGRENWDYRFAWLRDLSLVMRALWVGACPDEPERFFAWIDRTGDAQGHQGVQIMYGVGGERDLTEHMLDHMEGYLGSRPVRVGNDAWKQKQLDVLGEVLDAAYLLKEKLGDMSGFTRRVLVTLAQRAASDWREPDSGMWEARDRERHYLSSKLMCWVALDRAVKLASRLGVRNEAGRWERERDEIRDVILSRGWSEKAQAFTGSFDSDDLDASVLLMPIVGFLPVTDPRMKATIDAVERTLGKGGLICRWPEEPNGFILCSYWMVECLALAGQTDRAMERFDQVCGYCNDLGLFSEVADPVTGEMLGNFPQAFSHIGLINAAWQLSIARPPGSRASSGREDRG